MEFVLKVQIVCEVEATLLENIINFAIIFNNKRNWE